MAVICEACGSCSASSLMHACATCQPGSQVGVGCHISCLPRHRYSTSSKQRQFTCMACSQRASTNKGSAVVTRKSTRTAALRKAFDGGKGQHTSAQAGAGGQAALRKAGGGRTGPARSGVDWSRLPPELLPAILRRIPQRHRFSSSARVCTAWAAAAVAATRSISIKRSQALALQHAWAACAPRFAGQLTHLSLSSGKADTWANYATLLHLPCTSLRSLKVSDVLVQLKSAPVQTPLNFKQAFEAAEGQQAVQEGPEFPGLLDWATGLTRLSLVCRELCGSLNTQLAALAALTDLQDLQLEVSVPSQYRPRAAAELLSDSFLGQLCGLTKLTSLQLSSATRQQLWSGAGMQHISHLTRLQRLSLHSSRADWFGFGPADTRERQTLFLEEPATVLECLTALTKLELCGRSVGALPDLGTMPALKHFVLANCPGWDPAMLAAATGLQHLAVSAPGQGADSSNLLLHALQQQTQLTCLKVHHFSADPSALVASINLHELHLQQLTEPAGAWHQLFSPDGQVQHLTTLELSGPGIAHAVARLRLLVLGCPALQQLALRLPASNGTWAGQEVGVLTELSHLTRLDATPVTDENIRQLRKLTQLRELQLPNSDLSLAGVKGLTKMQHLTRLAVPLPLSAQEARCRWRDGTGFACSGQAAQPVWKQLQRAIKAAEARLREEQKKKRQTGYDPTPAGSWRRFLGRPQQPNL